MYIQSGELVTISRLREKTRGKFLSIRVCIFAVCIFAGMVPLAIGGVIVINACQTKMVENRGSNAKYTMQILADRLSGDASVSENITSSLQNEIEQMADIYNSRIVIVDDNYKVVLDTFHIDNDASCISSDVLRTLTTGNSYENYDKHTRQMKFTVPIQGKINAGKETKGTVKGVIVVSLSTEEFVLIHTNLNNKLAMLCVLVLFLLILFASGFSKLCVAPLHELTKKLQCVADGNLDTNLISDRYAEINQVTNALNQVLEQLRKVEKSRQEFVSNVSHELKTPITSIRVLADSLMLLEDAPVEMYQEFLGDISDEIDREAKIIDDLLSMVRMDKSAAKMQIEKVDMNELIESILKRVRPIAKRKEIELVFESNRSVMAEIDETKFSLAVTNLIENAVKYNNVGGWVRVSLDADYKYCYIKVEDNGIGIPDESKEHLFERFYRVDKARSRETGGTGLGLAITKDVILLHNGQIRLDSQLGEGSTFTVRIPLKHIA